MTGRIPFSHVVGTHDSVKQLSNIADRYSSLSQTPAFETGADAGEGVSKTDFSADSYSFVLSLLHTSRKNEPIE